MAVSRMRAYLIAQVERARQEGHELRINEAPGRGPGGRDLFFVVCSCGYSSTRRNTHGLALGAAFAHVGDVTAEAREGARNGVSLPGSVRPAL